MNATTFGLNLTLPADARFAALLRDLAAHAARYAGGSSGAAERFGADVEATLRTLANGAAAGTSVTIVVRRAGGPLEVELAGAHRREVVTFAL